MEGRVLVVSRIYLGDRFIRPMKVKLVWGHHLNDFPPIKNIVLVELVNNDSENSKKFFNNEVHLIKDLKQGSQQSGLVYL